jgi:acyl carrier protein
MSVSDLAASLEAFVRVQGEVPDDDRQFGRDVDLFEAGYLDSVGVVALIVWIEQRYSIELTEDDLFDERFTTIEGIAAIIGERRQRLS